MDGASMRVGPRPVGEMGKAPYTPRPKGVLAGPRPWAEMASSRRNIAGPRPRSQIGMAPPSMPELSVAPSGDPGVEASRTEEGAVEAAEHVVPENESVEKEKDHDEARGVEDGSQAVPADKSVEEEGEKERVVEGASQSVPGFRVSQFVYMEM